MPSEDRPIFTLNRNAPHIDLRRIGKIVTYEVMETDLRALEDAAGQEKDALAFFTLCLGIAVPSGVGLGTTDPKSTVGFLLYAVTTGIFTVATIWFFVLWRRRQGAARRVLDDIRVRARLEAIGGREQAATGT
ncbi:hypothetical protein WME75_29065 [Sorangium sp. So ce1014]|uniref:hypothetical protein n=1 Tax=Sorangium sp. So ce1014 TaxID=3133326 RepID=UPI003F61B837